MPRQSRLSGAVRADDSQILSRGYAKRKSIESLDTPSVFKRIEISKIIYFNNTAHLTPPFVLFPGGCPYGASADPGVSGGRPGAVVPTIPPLPRVFRAVVATIPPLLRVLMQYNHNVLNEFQDDHWRSVSSPETFFHDTGIAALSVFKSGSDDLK